MSKKGVSDVITTVLMILIVLAAIGIVWAVVSSFLNNSTEQIDLGAGFSQIDIVDNSIKYLPSDVLQIKVKRDSNPGNISGLRVIIESSEGNVQSYDIETSVKELETKTIDVQLQGKIQNISKVSIAPRTPIKNKIKTGQTADEQSLGKGVVSNEGLVLYLPLDSDFNDKSGNGNNGSCTGSSCPVSSTGKIGNGYDFDGVDDYINFLSIPSGRGQTDYSLSLWVKSNSQDGIAFGQDEWDVNSDGIKVYLQTGKICGKTLDVICTVSANYNNDNWHHVVLFRNGASIQNLYVDGVYIINSIGGGINNDGGLGFKIGADYEGDAGSLNYFKGLIDEVIIYNRSLSSQEIYYLYKYG